jgi:hypothetical protein
VAGEWVTQRSDAASSAYVDWVTRGPGGLYPPKYSEQQRLPIVVKLRPGATLRNFIAALESKFKDRDAHFEVPEIYLRPEAAFFGSLQVFTATVDGTFFEMLHSNERAVELVERVIASQVLPPDAICGESAVSAPEGDAEAQITPVPGPGARQGAHDETVVIGIIDEGIAFAHQRFRRKFDVSRVEYTWLQDGPCLLPISGGFGYGRELHKGDRQDPSGNTVPGIDTLLRNCTINGMLDEELFYKRAGLIDFERPGHKAAAQRTAHGTHVMDLACGYDEGTSPTVDGLEARPIVCVQLPTVTVADTSGLGLERYMIDAVEYILDRAAAIRAARNCAPLSVVINFSSGILAGPHDGTHPIELVLDDIIRQRRRRVAPTDIVLPSGNSHLSRIHAKTSLPPKNGDVDNEDNAVELKWQVPPDCKTCSYLEIWLPHGASKDSVKLRLVPPDGEVSPALPSNEGDTSLWKPNQHHGLCKIYFEVGSKEVDRCRFVVALLPTAFDEPPTQLAPSGTWKILLQNTTTSVIEDVEAWIQWDDRPLGYPRSGRQSVFLDERYVRFDPISGREIETDDGSSIIKREGSINAIATGSESVVVGGFNRQQLTVVKYSAGGPVTRTAGALDRAGPDALAVSHQSVLRSGVLAAGTRSGSRVAMNGTSVAAPQIAREITCRRAKGDHRDGRVMVEDLARLQELGRQPPPPKPSALRGGWGRIETPTHSSSDDRTASGTPNHLWTRIASLFRHLLPWQRAR